MLVGNTMKRIRVPNFSSDPKMMRFPAYAEIKYDGEYNEYHSDENILMNKYGKTRTDCPITDELKSITGDCVLRGELIYGTGQHGGVYALLSNKQSHDLKYVVFDVLEYEGESLVTLPYIKRRDIIDGMKEMSDHVTVSSGVYCDNQEELDKAYQAAIDLGFEGIVVKNVNSAFTPWYKIKAKETLDLAVTTIDPVKERVSVGYKGRDIGVKVGRQYKAMLIVGDIIEVEHQGVLARGGLRHPVFKMIRDDKEVADV